MGTSGAERRQAITDAGIRVIARDGVRALTHRAVDREAQIPQGSTSYHARTRAGLVELIVDELTARSTADADDLAEVLRVRLDEREQRIDPDELAGLIAGLVERLAARRDEMRTRYALLLELGGESELRAKLTTDSTVHTVTRRITAAALAAAGLPASDEAVEELIALTDSLVFHRTVIHEPVVVRAILAAYLVGTAGPTTDSGQRTTH